MHNFNAKTHLPLINSFEKFEELKLINGLFENIAKEIITYHDLPNKPFELFEGNKKLLREFLITAGYTPEKMTPLLSRQLTALMLLHRYSNLNVQIRIKNWRDKGNSIDDFEKLVWNLEK